MTYRILILLIFVTCCRADDDGLPIGVIAHVGFRVADLEKTRAFYTGRLGIHQAFDQKDATGKVTLAVFKINDDQFLEFSPGGKLGFTHVAFQTHEIERLRQILDTFGLHPPELRTGRDRTRNFSLQDPEGRRVEFVQYEPDSMQAQVRGKFDGANPYLSRIGISAGSETTKLYWNKLRVSATVTFLPANAPLRLYIHNSRAVPNYPHGEVQDPDGVPIVLTNNGER
jgi:catechol 2,3-dioxygenase-like lactoylglutathione lyase family enzyme